MNKYNFDFGEKEQITINNKGLYISAGLIDLLGNPQELNIGIDREKKVLGIRKADKNTKAKVYKIENHVVTCRKIVKTIRELCDKTYIMAEYDKDIDMFIAVLK